MPTPTASPGVSRCSGGRSRIRIALHTVRQGIPVSRPNRPRHFFLRSRHGRSGLRRDGRLTERADAALMGRANRAQTTGRRHAKIDLARPWHVCRPFGHLPACMISLDLAVNAIVAGLLLGGFYAAVTVGVTISFGMLDI